MLILLLGSTAWWLVTVHCFDEPHVFSPLPYILLSTAFTEWATGKPIFSKFWVGKTIKRK